MTSTLEFFHADRLTIISNKDDDAPEGDDCRPRTPVTNAESDDDTVFEDAAMEQNPGVHDFTLLKESMNKYNPFDANTAFSSYAVVIPLGWNE